MKYFKPSGNPNEIFVFGANLAGNHGLGAALEAKLHWGAKTNWIYRTGNSFGIPTKGWVLEVLPLNRIMHEVEKFITYAKDHPELTFLVTPIGTGLAGYKLEDIAPMFEDAPKNCELAWKD